MKRLFTYLIVILLLTHLYSCQKEYSITNLPVTVTDSSNANPTPAPTGNPTVADNSYQPFTKGSFWKYKDSATGDITTQVATGKTKTINGSLFKLALSSNPVTHVTDTVYYYHDQVNYSLFESAAMAGNSGAFLINYHNDTVPVGHSWEYVSGQGNGFEASMKATLLEKNIDFKVNNVVYHHVVHSYLEMSYNLLGNITPVAGYGVYVAKNVGIIKLTSVGLGLAAGKSIVTTLTGYSIK